MLRNQSSATNKKMSRNVLLEVTMYQKPTVLLLDDVLDLLINRNENDHPVTNDAGQEIGIETGPVIAAVIVVVEAKDMNVTASVTETGNGHEDEANEMWKTGAQKAG